MKIRIGHLSTFYHTSILLLAQGRVEKQLDAGVEWRLMGSGPELMRAFERRELDLAYVGLPPAIVGMSRGIDVACVAGGHMEGTVLAGKKRWAGFPGERDLGAVLRQFRGGAIGTPAAGSIHDIILRDCLARHGLEGDIRVVNFPWADLVTEAVAGDEVAAAVGTPALAISIDRFAGGKVLYPASGLWPDNPSYGIVADRGFITKERGRLERFLRLHEEAAAFIRNETATAARLIADFVGIVDERFVLDTLMVSPRYCALLTEEYIGSTMRFVPVLRSFGYLQADISRDRIFSPELILKVHPEGNHYGDGVGNSSGVAGYRPSAG